MSAAEREERLADMHAGVLKTAWRTAGRTLAVSIWYSYQLGGLPTSHQSLQAVPKDNQKHRVRDLDRSQGLGRARNRTSGSVRRERETPADLDGARSAGTCLCALRVYGCSS